LPSKIDAGLELLSALGSTELKPIEIRDLLYKGYSYASCHQGQSILEVVAAMRLGTARTEALTRS